MDCPKCGVYNPEDRTNCWRCGAELPKQAPKTRRDPQASARVWLYIGFAVIVLVTVLRMCGVSVPGLPSDDNSTGRAPTQPALTWVVSAEQML